MEARYHIPDFYRHLRLNLTLAEYMERSPQAFNEGTEIASVYGSFPSAIWNGGRFIGGGADPRMIGGIINEFNRRGIPLRFTFTNPVITIEHLKDPLCNKIMEAADNGLNEVIVYSQMLEDYIRDKYPNYAVTSSTCRQIEDGDELEKEMNRDYKYVVLDYNWNNNFEMLERLPCKEKAELLINACCMPGCKRRGEHYRSIGRSQVENVKHIMARKKEPYTPEPFACECMAKTLYQTVDSPLHISPEAIYEKYIPMGYSNFKIEGRSVPDVNVLENYIYYMVKPEHRDEVRLEMLLLLTKNTKYFQ
ncbi:MAG: hypothetical protein ACI4KF_00790 [Huintestinicola sp.]